MPGTEAAVRLPDTRLLIAGDWVDAASGAIFETVNPATEEVIASVADPGPEDVDKAVTAARAALSGPWGTMAASQRARLLNTLAGLIRSHSEEIVALESLDSGKPVSAVRRQDLPAVLDCIEYFAGWCDKITGDVVPVRTDALTYVTREPIGVVGGIVPWNFPLMNAMWKIGPALACGCTMVLKPAGETPLSALYLGELALEAGLPEGVLNILPGPGAKAGMALVQHPEVNKITFTGSPGVGKTVMAAAAAGVKHVTLELGGKSPNLIFADADLELAVRSASSGIFFNSGQVCSADSRILVQESVYEDFCDAMVEYSRGLKVGDPSQPGTYMGPLISQRQLDRVMSYIEQGKAEGATLRTGGDRLDSSGYFVEPTVFTGVLPRMTIAREEIFGPVASVMPFTDEDDAVAIANSSPYSLAAGVWTSDLTRAHVVSQRLRAGTVWVNAYGQSDTRLPWGGMGGESGSGRDLGSAAIDRYTEMKTVWVSLRRR